MPQAATHIIIPLVLADIYRDYISKIKFNIRYVLIAGLAGLLPDIDVLIGWILNLFRYFDISQLHRTFTHTLFFPLVFLILFLLTRDYNPRFIKKQKLNLNYIFLATAFGVLIHILLDALFSGPVYLLPGIQFGFNLIPLDIFQGTFFAGIDAIVLVLWLIHEELKHRISDYI
ncbi:metal-dependent hydrolase [Candidatus Woesearchaeota archaeon]|nr:metal-dependent hydrolase [Candidatus Woesearchaeota archaeon]